MTLLLRQLALTLACAALVLLLSGCLEPASGPAASAAPPSDAAAEPAAAPRTCALTEGASSATFRRKGGVFGRLRRVFKSSDEPKAGQYVLKTLTCEGETGILGERSAKTAADCKSLEATVEVADLCESCSVKRRRKGVAVVSADAVEVKCAKKGGASMRTESKGVGAVACRARKVKFVKKAVDAICAGRTDVANFRTIVEEENLAAISK